MNYDTSSIEREIANAKGTLVERLSEAEDKVREVADWRTHFRRNPLPFLAGAAALGLVASALTDRVTNDAPRGLLSEAGGSARNAIASSHVPGRAGHAFEQLADVLIAVGTAKVAKYVDAWLPGFHEEFNRRG